MTTRCGFIGFLGKPNVGKSTLLNALVGEKVAITSRKAQTTRFPIQGVRTEGETQFVFVDTPGIIAQPEKRLQKSMMQSLQTTVQSVDQLLVIFDVTRDTPLEAATFLTQQVLAQPFSLVLNKIDRIDKEKLLAWATQLQSFNVDIFMISARSEDGLPAMLAGLNRHMPEGPWLFPAETLSNLSEKMWCAEITREVILGSVHQEIPHELYVETQELKRKKGGVRIDQTIHVLKKSHKTILLGRQGQMVKKISIKARSRMQHFFEEKVHLFLYVRHTPDWTERQDFYQMCALENKP